MTSDRYDSGALIDFALKLLQAAGLAQEPARAVAEILVEADLMGHSTHGLALLGSYLREIEVGSMTREGKPEIVADQGSAVTWDGRYLPGPWIVCQALDLALQRIAEHPVMTVAIRRSHHIACLAAYLTRATDKGLLIVLASSDPNVKAVAPYGGIEPLYTPNPLAAGIPTQGDPILIDISMSTTAMSMVTRLRGQGQTLPHDWLMDNQGQPSNDPAVMFTDPPGSILPLGGLDLGYKGFALGLLVEALSGALAGHGRSTPPNRWGSSVFLQLIDPQAFGGAGNFARETEWLAEASRNTATRPGDPPVRLPGGRALQLRAEQLREGVALYPTILPSLQPWIEKLGVAVPPPISNAG